jgi:hypothetical protein
LWAAWKLGNELLTPWQALASATLLEAGIYYSWTTPEFNNNSTAKLCWALASLLLYYGLKHQRVGYWAASGVMLGVAFLSKYDVALLGCSFLLFSICHPRGRAAWRTPGPYAMVAAAAVVVLPHVWWMVANGFPTIKYVVERSGNPATVWSHVKNPAKFLFSQCLAVGLPLAIAMLALSWRALPWRWQLKKVDNDDARFQRSFVTTVVLGPLVIAVVYSALTGAIVKSMWGSQMFTFLGVLLFTWFETKPDPAALRRVVWASACAGLAVVAVYGARNVVGSKIMNHNVRVDFPGQRITAEVEKIWQEVSDAPLKNVAGESWISGNVHVYHPQRPSVFIELDDRLAPWVDRESWRREGGVIVWNAQVIDEEYRTRVRAQFPTAEFLPTLEFPWEKAPHRQPLEIAMAIVRPDPALSAATAASRDHARSRNKTISFSRRGTTP